VNSEHGNQFFVRAGVPFPNLKANQRKMATSPGRTAGEAINRGSYFAVGMVFSQANSGDLQLF
jgi:hypothetical protein